MVEAQILAPRIGNMTTEAGQKATEAVIRHINLKAALLSDKLNNQCLARASIRPDSKLRCLRSLIMMSITVVHHYEIQNPAHLLLN